jgi:hypothetical protein
VAVTTTADNSSAPSPSALKGVPARAQNIAVNKNAILGRSIGLRYVSRGRLPSIIKVRPSIAANEYLGRSSHNHGLNAARAALIVAAGVTGAGAKDVHTEFAVTATVRAVANIELQSVPADLEITAADLQRGFVDVARPTQFIVRSNSQNGFALEVLTVAPMLSSMTITGLDSDLYLGADGGTVVQRWRQAQARKLSLKFRFELAPGLKAGDYPWPVRLAVRPLEST